MLLKGKTAELMAAVNPKLYRKYIAYDKKGNALLYVRMHKALYGLLRSALLFYRKLIRDLQEYGFVLNPYDAYVANKDINGQQMTVTWHVEDLKVSHKDPFEITKFAHFLSKIHGQKLVVHRGKYHGYLGMDLDYSQKGKVKISMIKYLNKVLNVFPEEIKGSTPSPAAGHLSKI